MGGTAYLSLENSEDPYLHGVKFTAMPPTKRFREMEQLSGGEKVCSSALIAPLASCLCKAHSKLLYTRIYCAYVGSIGLSCIMLR